MTPQNLHTERSNAGKAFVAHTERLTDSDENHTENTGTQRLTAKIVSCLLRGAICLLTTASQQTHKHKHRTSPTHTHTPTHQDGFTKRNSLSSHRQASPLLSTAPQHSLPCETICLSAHRHTQLEADKHRLNSNHRIIHKQRSHRSTASCTQTHTHRRKTSTK